MARADVNTLLDQADAIGTQLPGIATQRTQFQAAADAAQQQLDAAKAGLAQLAENEEKLHVMLAQKREEIKAAVDSAYP